MLVGSLFTLGWCLLSVSASIATSHFASQGGLKPLLNDELDAFVNRVLQDWNSPGGVAIAVVRLDSQGSWVTETRGYGMATINGAKVTEKTLFSLGSNSKVSFARSRRFVEFITS